MMFSEAVSRIENCLDNDIYGLEEFTFSSRSYAPRISVRFKLKEEHEPTFSLVNVGGGFNLHSENSGTLEEAVILILENTRRLVNDRLQLLFARCDGLQNSLNEISKLKIGPKKKDILSSEQIPPIVDNPFIKNSW